MICVVLFLSCICGILITQEANGEILEANAKMQKHMDPTTNFGFVSFAWDTTANKVTVSGTLTGLTPPGKHGFHIHQYGNFGGTTHDCAKTGEHWNPTKASHGGLTNERHIGDMGNIDVDAGGNASIDLTFNATDLPLQGPKSIVGRAVVIHVGTDDLGKGSCDTSSANGCAGARLACGLVGINNAALTAASEKQTGFKANANRETQADITSADGKTIYGTVSITQDSADGKVFVKGTLNHVTPASQKHGLHVHLMGSLTDGCTSAQGHFNPMGSNHSGPTEDNQHRHIGDLGNIDVFANGTAHVNLELMAEKLPLVGPQSIVGRMMVLHSGVDDLGAGSCSTSLANGCAGTRLGCGVIGITSDFSPAGPCIKYFSCGHISC